MGMWAAGVDAALMSKWETLHVVLSYEIDACLTAELLDVGGSVDYAVELKVLQTLRLPVDQVCVTPAAHQTWEVQLTKQFIRSLSYQ
jgi:hypothetical protein